MALNKTPDLHNINFTNLLHVPDAAENACLVAGQAKLNDGVLGETDSSKPTEFWFEEPDHLFQEVFTLLKVV